MRSHFRNSVCFLAVMLVGLMSGLMLGTGMDQYTHKLLSASAWVKEHQVMDALFRRVLPPLWNLTMVSLAAAAVLTRGRSRWLFAFAAAIFLFSLVVTITVEVPMNRSIAQWKADSVPSEWATVRDRWLSFHLARTIGGFVAFLSALAGFMKNSDSHIALAEVEPSELRVV